MSKLKNVVKVISVNLIILFALLCIIELVLQVVFVNSTDKKILNYASFSQLAKNKSTPMYSPHRYLGYYPTPNRKKGSNYHNSRGFRGPEITVPKPKDCFRIICIGGSTTYTTKAKDFRKSYPYLLQEELNRKAFHDIEVINSGVGGWSSWESFVNFQFRLLDLDPDLIVIYHSINDIHPRIVWPPESYVGDNSGRRIDAFVPPRGWKDFFIEKSNILRIFAIEVGMKKSNRWLDNTIDPFPDTFHLYEFKKQLEQNTYPSNIFEKVTVSDMLERNKPIYFQRNIEGIVELAKNRGIHVVLSTFAYSTSFQNLFINSPEYICAFEEHNHVIADIAMNSNVAFFDFAKLFPNDRSLFADGRHVTEKGARLKAKLFGEFIGDYLESHALPTTVNNE